MRLRYFIVILALLAASPAAVAAAVSAPGIELRWDNCFEDGGAWNKQFACDTNTGSSVLVLSFVLDTPMSDVTGGEILVDVASVAAVLPAWWQFRNFGTCRQSSLGMNMVPPATAVNCLDWAQGNAGGGIGAYSIGVNGPNSARVAVAVAVPSGSQATLAAQQEYFSANLVVNHAKTVGTGACAGCTEPVCIVYQSLRLTTTVAANDRVLYRGANGEGSHLAYWQNAYATNVVQSCDTRFPLPRCTTSFTCALASVTATRGSTWGAVKSLYR